MARVNSSLMLLILFSLIPSAAQAWDKEGKWSTTRFNCSGSLMKIGVDMTSRTGGGDASPVRNAYMTVNGKTMPSVWIVGGSMDSVETNTRDYTLVTNSSVGSYLMSIGSKEKKCKSIQKAKIVSSLSGRRTA